MPQALPFVRAEIDLVWLLPSMTQGPVWKQMEGQCEGSVQRKHSRASWGLFQFVSERVGGGQLGLSIQG